MKGEERGSKRKEKIGEERKKRGTYMDTMPGLCRRTSPITRTVISSAQVSG